MASAMRAISPDDQARLELLIDDLKSKIDAAQEASAALAKANENLAKQQADFNETKRDADANYDTQKAALDAQHEQTIGDAQALVTAKQVAVGSAEAVLSSAQEAEDVSLSALKAFLFPAPPAPPPGN